MKGEIIVDLINREGLCFDSGVFDNAEKAFEWARGRGSNYRVDFYWRSLGEDASAVAEFCFRRILYCTDQKVVV